MGRFVFIAGPNDSGKSARAEALTAAAPGPRYYIATMVPKTEDNLARIERHRRQRAGLGFTTLELPERIADAPVPPDAAVLLEDLSNLLANRMFAEHAPPPRDCLEAVYREVLSLRARTAFLAVVSIAGLDPADYEGETADYVRALNELNRRLKTL